MTMLIFPRRDQFTMSRELEAVVDENKRLRDQVVDLVLQREILRERLSDHRGSRRFASFSGGKSQSRSALDS